MTDAMRTLARLFSTFDPEGGTIDGCPILRRRLSDLAGVFADAEAYRERLQSENPVLYTVSTFDAPAGEGALHCGLGVIYPGRIGDEYFMTRGHLHSRRETAEFYIGLRGKGLMLLQGEDGSGEQTVDLVRDSIAYVPGHTAHRTVNTGDDPLVYLGIYPATAGHDYETIAQDNFRSVVIMRNGTPVVLPRRDFLDTLQARYSS
jgi:glucose-6-phosphate isomerase